MKLYSLFANALKVAATTYIFICFGMYALQRSFIYHPAVGANEFASYHLKEFGDITLHATDGVRIDAWHRKAKTGYPTLLFFHGNGGRLAMERNYFTALTDAGFGILAIDYRGYGASEGNPSEQGFYLDARAAMEYAIHTLDLPPDRILIYGESLGTGVAVEMAAEYPASGLVLQSPYTSVEALSATAFPWLPISLLLKDKFDSVGKITRVHAPLLLMHGEKDTIVPVRYGRELFAQANEPKETVYFPSKGHNDMEISERVDALLAFAQKQRLIKN